MPKKKPNPRSLQVKDPERYKAVVESLKHGNSLTKTSVDCGVARPTVDKIKYENKDQLTEWKWRNVNKIAGIVIHSTCMKGQIIFEQGQIGPSIPPIRSCWPRAT